MKKYQFSTDYKELFKLVMAGHKVIAVYSNIDYVKGFYPTFENHHKDSGSIYLHYDKIHKTKAIWICSENLYFHSVNDCSEKTKEENIQVVFEEICKKNRVEFLPNT